MGSMTTRYRYSNVAVQCLGAWELGQQQSYKHSCFFRTNMISYTPPPSVISRCDSKATPLCYEWVLCTFISYVAVLPWGMYICTYVRTRIIHLFRLFFSDAGTYRAYFCEGWCDVWLGVVWQTAGWSKNRRCGRGVNMITYHTQFASMHDSISQIRTSFYFIKK